jgi:nitroimidazol reductase NimA-like FMN-containing flavoprotein (pyridoxamine 5'-phosphate oxidase superfamily)
MQHRMKTHRMSESEIEALFGEAKVGRLATLNPDGFPYVTPVHFVYYKGKIYIHGLIKGQKNRQPQGNPKVCFEIDKMVRLCRANSRATSIRNIRASSPSARR